MALNPMEIVFTIILILVEIGMLVGVVTLLVLLIRALLKYLRPKSRDNSQNVDVANGCNQAETLVLQSLGEALKTARTDHKLTQEYVAESLGVSRQAVSKWENGTSDPSTANLIALAKLYDVTVESLLANVT